MMAMHTTVSARIKLIAHKAGILSLARKIYTARYAASLIKKYKKFKSDGKLPLPDTIIWEPTGKCNLRCKFCYINFSVTSKTKEMNFDEFKIMMEKLPFIKHILMIGGELTLRNDLLDILDYLNSKGIKVLIGTNATLISESMVKSLTKYKNMLTVVVSIDGPEEIHNKIRGWNQAFQRSIANIKLMRKHGIFVSVVSVITKDNLDNLGDIATVVSTSKANNLALEFERMYTKESVSESAKLLGIENNFDNFPIAIGDRYLPDYSLEELENSISTFEKTAKKQSLTIGYMPVYFKDKLRQYFGRTLKNEEHFCKQLFVPRIDCSGNVIFCFAIKKSFGNILKQSFEEIWHGDELTEFRKKFLASPVLPICNTCEKLITT